MIKDVSNLIDVFDTPCCPFCDQPIFDSTLAMICESKNNHFLSHTFCVEEAFKDLKEDEL